MIGIVIPFYQREKGLLLRAVQSVLQQTSTLPWRIVVVDDGSPVDAETDLRPLRDTLGERLTVIRQPNAGASAARNRALDCFGSETEIVAFLDSDDVWEKDHLARAMVATEAGADFFFENCQRSDESNPRFSESHFRLDQFPILDKAHEIYWFDADFFDVLFRRSPVLPSTVAYRFSMLPSLRFRVDLLGGAGEDIYFFLEASVKIQKIALSPKIGTFMGAGINISRATWGTFGNTGFVKGMARYHKLVGDSFKLTESQKQWNSRVLRGLDRDFWQSILADTARGEYRSLSLAGSYLAMRPGAVRQIPSAFMHAVQRRIFKLQAR